MTWYQRDNLDIFLFYLFFIIIAAVLLVKLFKLYLSDLRPKYTEKLKDN